MVKPFENPAVLGEMLHLREAGWTLKSISDVYHVDFSTIYYHSKRNSIVVSQEFSVPLIVRLVVPKPSRKPLCYRDYLMIERSRNLSPWQR